MPNYGGLFKIGFYSTKESKEDGLNIIITILNITILLVTRNTLQQPMLSLRVDVKTVCRVSNNHIVKQSREFFS